MSVNTTQKFQNQSLKISPNAKLAFKATPKEILSAVETVKMCPGKKRLLTDVATFFSKAEEQLSEMPEAPKEFVFKLGKQNEIPNSMNGISIQHKNPDGDLLFVSLKDIDKELNGETFKCSPKSTCSCGQGVSKGGFMSNLLKIIGVENPSEILIKKK